MPHGFPLRHGLKDVDALLPLLLKFSVEYTTSKATINPGGMETDQDSSLSYSVCALWMISLLVPTDAHIVLICVYRCPRRNVPLFGRVFLMLKYTDITQNTYVQSWTVTEIMAREKCGLLAGPRTVPVSWQSYPCPSLSVVSYDSNSAHASPKLRMYFLQGDNVVHVAAALWMVGRLVVRSC